MRRDLPPIDAAGGAYRERAIVPGRTALLSIDMQNAEYSSERLRRAREGSPEEAKYRAFLERMGELVLPNQARLLAAARAAGIEVVFTVIESLTRDGRDRSLDHKISRIHHPKGSWEAQVIDEVGPRGDEILIPKTSSGIFNSTNVDYVLRNLGIEFLVVFGVMTDQCVESAVRDAADRGYLVTQIEDACAAETDVGHRRSIEAMAGHYGRMRTTDEMITEIAWLSAGGTARMTAGPGRALGRVLLTGAEGFVGRALAARLAAAGQEVVASDLAATTAGTRACDLTDGAQVDALVGDGPFATILHCGAVSGPMVLADRPRLVWRINAEGTANLLEAARRHGAGRLVLCSTVDVYGEATGRVDETTLPRPASVYAASKLAAEHAGAAYAASFGMDVVSLRIAWVYGPGRRTPTQLEAALRLLSVGENADLDAHPADPAHYLHLDDAVEGVLKAAAAPRLPRSVYDMAPSRSLSMGGVADALGALFPGRRVTCARAAPGAPIPQTIDGTAASRDFGYVPRVRFEEGVARLAQSLTSASP